MGAGDEELAGRGLLRASAAATLAFAAAATAAAVFPDALAAPVAGLDVTLFLAGCAAFVWTLLRAAARSRSEELTVGGLWLLTTAPRPVRRWLLGAVAAQVVVALATASSRPYTALAFGILVPLAGVASCGLWAVAHAPFPPRAGSGTPVGHNARASVPEGGR